ncbi:MAG: hypothetical protein VYE64_12340 [Planctomycetota bacterium]|nr:hypothetical protein [Planctomycetota bacterium]
MYHDYRDKVRFYYIYKNVQHPEINNFVSAFTLEERLRHVQEAKRRLKTEIPWICDDMNNSFKQAFGGAPNGEFILDPQGKIVRKRFWSNPQVLREDLAELVGPSETVTQVDALQAGFTLENRRIASGVVPRVALPSGLAPLIVEPVDDGGFPYFAKLRAEATPGLLGNAADGKLYLAVYLDPLYQVHWNNRAGKVKLTLEIPPGAAADPLEMFGPVVEADADVDPRQFLVDMARGDSKGPMEVELSYTVCDDAEKFCTEVVQRYRVEFKPTGDVGSRPGIFMPAMFAKIREFDKNGDGDITEDELPPGSVSLYVGHADYNGNGTIEAAEIDTFLQMFNNGKGFESDLNDGQEEKGKPPTKPSPESGR